MVSHPALVWGREPQLLQWKIQTWEHAILKPDTFGNTRAVRNSLRFLPMEVTKPIYVALAEQENNIIRLTEPLPPFEVRLLRALQIQNTDSVEEGVDTVSMPAIEDPGTLFSRRFCDVVPNWDEVVNRAILSLPQSQQENCRKWDMHGIPQGEFSIRYGYRLNYTVFSGKTVGIETHESLLMNRVWNSEPPGERRHLKDLLL